MRGSLMVALALAACTQPPSARQKARDDARAVAQVERMNVVPPFAAHPQAITIADIETHDLSARRCRFVDGAGEQASMLFVAAEEKGWLKLEGKMIMFSSDRSSDRLSGIAWSKYVGLAGTVTLARDAAAERTAGMDAGSTPGGMVIRDAKDRVVFSRSGVIDCET